VTAPARTPRIHPRVLRVFVITFACQPGCLGRHRDYTYLGSRSKFGLWSKTFTLWTIQYPVPRFFAAPTFSDLAGLPPQALWTSRITEPFRWDPPPLVGSSGKESLPDVP
jgi:hypothetical protein